MRAATPGGGGRMLPPLSKKDAEKILKRTISNRRWRLVDQAFADYGYRLRKLGTSKGSRKKDDIESWHVRQTKAVKALESAMEKIKLARSNNGDFLNEASENYSLKTFRHSYFPEDCARALLDEAFLKLVRAATIIERAEPDLREVDTKPESRCILARDLKSALIEKDEEILLSDRRVLPADPAETDLTPFEQLLSALEVHDAATPRAFSVWLSRALKDQNRGNLIPLY